MSHSSVNNIPSQVNKLFRSNSVFIKYKQMLDKYKRAPLINHKP